jgi:hypothetical protein
MSPQQLMLKMRKVYFEKRYPRFMKSGQSEMIEEFKFVLNFIFTLWIITRHSRLEMLATRRPYVEVL